MGGKNKITLPRLLELLEIEELPGGRLLEAFVLSTATRLIEEHGEDWIREQRVRLVEELEYIIKQNTGEKQIIL
ncbi:hypothetical protein [Sporomusa acidovorans]|uniref:Uncharacterized protein n=1 Tax=Sporomusa acidovorans (strain ATCC 49682 / DSM 3132 / Mol) TaxID=1123286 RepID=A0ABZ3IYB8_SPOA4|nr:hypothetical protein [Sporomusa acidovorans]OZC16824.1 hypothetical protein SPACI_40440 [Sporomusa acidovorans DSM 3132]SDF23537.1 hypothetical protein SAMN04488499_10396 [Sporomusa acidovorans]